MFSNLKIPMGLSCLLVSTLSFAKFNYPCSGTPGSYHTNPDTSVGGFVASTASVDATVTITPEASVCERSTVLEGAMISDRAVVSGKATVRGDVYIGGNAKIFGEAYIINTNGAHLMIMDSVRIYGHAFLQGSVHVSGTSEVFGWGKLLDFSQLIGHSLICGSSVVKNNVVLVDDSSNCVQK